jgi:rhodanese-related sulfurtransferase
MPTTVKELLEAASAAAPRLPPAEVRKLIDQGDVLLVDVRDASEIKATGKLRGAVHIPRGMLEFRADPDLPSHEPAFEKAKTILVYCGSGMRAALAGKTLRDFGYQRVYNAGGFKELADDGIATEPPG